MYYASFCNKRRMKMKKLFLGLAFLLTMGLVFGLDKPDKPKTDSSKEKAPVKKITLEERIQNLIKDLGNENFKVREKATEALKRIGPPAVPYLKKALASKEPEVQWRAKNILRQIGGIGVKPLPKTTPRPQTTPEEEKVEPPIRFRFGFITPEMKRIMKDMGINPKLLEKLFPQFKEFEKMDKELEKRIRNLEKMLRKGFELGPQGKSRGNFKVYRFQNGKKFEETWQFRNGRWEKVPSGKGSENPNSRPRSFVPRTLPGISSSHKLGVIVEPLSTMLRYHLGLGSEGLLIKEVRKNSRADQAGILQDDIILGVNGTTIHSVSQLQNLVKKTGTEAMSITLLRQNKKITISVPKVEKNPKKDDKKKPKRKFF